MDSKSVKELAWIGSSKKDLKNFPLSIRKEMGYALYDAQRGGKHKDAYPLKGFEGASVLEIVKNDGQGTYRTMYSVQFEEIVYVVHAFQKKSKKGIKTPKHEMDLVKQRLQLAKVHYKEWLRSQGKE
jgi:phage-related protein